MLPCTSTTVMDVINLTIDCKCKCLQGEGYAHLQKICKLTGSLTSQTQSERHKSTLLAFQGEMIIPPDYCRILPRTDWKTCLVADADMLDLCQ